MATLIDRDKRQERIFRFADRLVDWGFPKEAEAVRAVAKGIKLEKTVDAVEVVRCCDCQHCDVYQKEADSETMLICMIHSFELVDPTDFCSYGERRTDG
jgi:hypothetical protein